MAVRRIPILGAMTAPGAVLVPILPLAEHTTNQAWQHPVLVFTNGSGNRVIHGTFDVPMNYVDSARLVIVWSSNGISGNVAWQFFYRAVGGNDTESLDQATVQSSPTLTDTLPSTSWSRMESILTLTDAHFAPGDTVQWRLDRDADNAADTAADSVYVSELLFEYEDA